MAVTMKNAVFWDLMQDGSCKNRRLGEKYRLHHHGGRNQQASKLVSLPSQSASVAGYC
jgi:hypothetical protein